MSKRIWLGKFRNFQIFSNNDLKPFIAALGPSLPGTLTLFACTGQNSICSHNVLFKMQTDPQLTICKLVMLTPPTYRSRQDLQAQCIINGCEAGTNKTTDNWSTWRRMQEMNVSSPQHYFVRIFTIFLTSLGHSTFAESTNLTCFPKRSKVFSLHFFPLLPSQPSKCS